MKIETLIDIKTGLIGAAFILGAAWCLSTFVKGCNADQKQGALLAKIDSLENIVPQKPDTIIVFITKDNKFLGTDLPASRVPEILIEVVDEKDFYEQNN